MSGLTIDRKFIIDMPTGVIAVRARNNSGAARSPGEVVIFDSSVSTDVAYTTTTSQDDAKVLGVVMNYTPSGDEGLVQIYGASDGAVVKVNGTTDIAAGDFLSTFTTAGIAAKATAGKAGVFAMALEAYTTNDSLGTIKAIILSPNRQDASATVSYGTSGQMAADGVAAANDGGTTAATARIDHAHANTADTPALTLGVTNTAGTAGKVLASDATVALFDATVPTTVQSDATATAGTAAYAARRDHTHAIVNDAPADGSSLATANAEGTSSGFARGDHAHKAIAINDVPVILGTTDAAGTAVRVEYDTAETNDALKIGVNTASRRIIIEDYGDMGTDSTLAAAADPTLTLYDATAAEFVSLDTDLTGATVNVSTGNNVNIAVAGTDEYTLDATTLTLASGNNLKFAGDDEIQTSGGTEVLEFNNTASAVNHLLIVPGATGTFVQLSAKGTGTDTNAGITLMAKGTGVILIDNDTDPVQLKLMGATGSYDNSEIVDLNGNELLGFQAVANAVNEFAIANNSTGNAPVIVSKGGDTNISMNLAPKGSGAVIINNDTDPCDLRMMGAAGALNKNVITDLSGLEVIELQPTAVAVNHVVVITGATGTPVVLSSAGTGTDTNASLRLTAKGTGVIQATQPTVSYMVQTALTDTTTVTIAQLMTKIIDGTPTGAAAYTLPTAALLVGGIANCRVGDSFMFFVNNKSAGANTITVGAGSGGTGDGTLTVAQNIIRAFLITVTNVTASTEAYFVYGIE